jgi:ankyrin repeat protein
MNPAQPKPSRRPPFLAFLPCLLALALAPSCSKTDPQQAALAELDAAGYSFSISDFHRAAGAGDEKAIDLFLAAGMAPDVRSEAGTSALGAAVIGDRTRTAATLIGLGADPNSLVGGSSLLMAASANGNAAITRQLVEAGADVSFRDEDNWGALMRAAYAGHAPVVEILAPKSLDQLDAAMHLAAVRGDVRTLDILLTNGADQFARSKDKRTALMFAAANGHLDAVRLLLERGSNPFAVDSEGNTAADLAAAEDHDAVHAYLIEPRTAPGEPGPSLVQQELVAATADQTTAAGARPEDYVGRPLSPGSPTGDASPDPSPTANLIAEARGNLGHGSIPIPSDLDLAPQPARDLADVQDRTTTQLADSASAPARSGAPSPRPGLPTRLDGTSLASVDPAPEAPPITETITLRDYREGQLPLMLLEVPDSASPQAVVRMLQGDPSPISVAVGDVLPTTRLAVSQIERRKVASKQGKGVPIDVSRILLEDLSSGEKFMVVRGTEARSSDTFALLQTPEGAFDARPLDEFTLGDGDAARTFRVLEIRPTQVIIAQIDTGETFTLHR